MKCMAATVIALGWFTGAAQAQVACTSIMSAAVSHFVTHNNEYGGHVNSHVQGQVPPPGNPQAVGTLFVDAEQYESAWTALSQEAPPLYCAEHPQVGTEAARDVPIHLTVRQCTSAGPNGVCTTSYSVTSTESTFVFRAMPNGNGVRWVLYNAYPRS